MNKGEISITIYHGFNDHVGWTAIIHVFSGDSENPISSTEQFDCETRNECLVEVAKWMEAK
jgi:hypothetical protein